MGTIIRITCDGVFIETNQKTCTMDTRTRANENISSTGECSLTAPPAYQESFKCSRFSRTKSDLNLKYRG